MGRGKNSGLVWRPVEYALLGVALLLVIALIWMLFILRNQDEQSEQATKPNIEDDTSISSVVERGIRAEEHVDDTYDIWEETSNAVVDSAADDIGGAINESAY